MVVQIPPDLQGPDDRPSIPHVPGFMAQPHSAQAPEQQQGGSSQNPEKTLYGGARTERPDGQVAQLGREDELVVRQRRAPLPGVQQPVLAQRQRQLVLRRHTEQHT